MGSNCVNIKGAIAEEIFKGFPRSIPEQTAVGSFPGNMSTVLPRRVILVKNPLETAVFQIHVYFLEQFLYGSLDKLLKKFMRTSSKELRRKTIARNKKSSSTIKTLVRITFSG